MVSIGIDRSQNTRRPARQRVRNCDTPPREPGSQQSIGGYCYGESPDFAAYPEPMFGALVARLLFAFAAACALAASAGIAVPPHQEEPGTPPYHEHVLAAYRFAFLLESPVREGELSHEMARLHQTLMAAGVPMDALWQMPGMQGAERSASALPVIKSAGLGPIQDLAIELALLVILLPRLPRPHRRVVAELPALSLMQRLWQLAPVLTPPRLIALP